MPGLDLSQVSSNWKKLQLQLKSEKKETPKNVLKRKRKQGDTREPVPRKARIIPNDNVKSKGAKMGYSQSKNSVQPARQRDTLVRTHEVGPDDLVAAYGSATDITRQTFSDDVNGGLHATHKAGKYVALDCEMVGTGPPPHEDHVLARVSLVNYHGEQIYDSYVQAPPKIRVEDYRTHVSGIKPHHMREGHARPFAQVQGEVSRIMDGRILVGHAVKNDLDVLMLSHPKRDIRDTSRYPKFRIESRGKPPALRNLAKSELGMSIQTGEHSSIVDARATMMLFKKEKPGFEEENNRRFGQSTRPAPKPMKLHGQIKGGSEEDDDDVEDADADEAAEDDTVANQTSSTGKKKRKKKKRTKRK